MGKEEEDIVIELDDEQDGDMVDSDNFVFEKIGKSVPLKPDDSKFDPESPPAQPLAVSDRFKVIFVAHSEGFYVAKTKDVIGSAKEIKEKGSGLCIQELCIVDLPIGKVHILALSMDSSYLAATVGGEIHLYAVGSLLTKEQQASFTCSLHDSSDVKDFRWRKKMVNTYAVLSKGGTLYHGDVDGSLKEVMDNVDAVDWSTNGNSVAVARKNTLSILSSKFRDRFHMSLLFKTLVGDPKQNVVGSFDGDYSDEQAGDTDVDEEAISAPIEQEKDMGKRVIKETDSASSEKRPRNSLPPRNDKIVNRPSASAILGSPVATVTRSPAVNTSRSSSAKTARNATVLPLFERVFDRADIGFEDETFELVHGFWIPSVHAGTYTKILKRHGHIVPSNMADSLGASVQVKMVRDLLVAAAGLYGAEQDPPSESRMTKWERDLSVAEYMQFNVAWLRELLKKAITKPDPRASKLSARIEQLIRERERLTNEVDVKTEEQRKIALEFSSVTDALGGLEQEAAQVDQELEMKRKELADLEAEI